MYDVNFADYTEWMDLGKERRRGHRYKFWVVHILRLNRKKKYSVKETDRQKTYYIVIKAKGNMFWSPL